MAGVVRDLIDETVATEMGSFLEDMLIEKMAAAAVVNQVIIDSRA
jgi:hypothetical protein